MIFEPKTRETHYARTLLASAARTATSTGEAAVRLPRADAYAFTLVVTAAATDAGDTLDVFVQTKLDGTNWTDVVAFTQVLGNGGAKRYIAKVVAALAQDDFEVGSALSAGEVRHLIGDEWRVRFAIADVSTDDASFTFSVSAIPM